MSRTMEGLGRKIRSARELLSVVKTMKAMAAVSIRQFERAAASLQDYDHAVQLGLAALAGHGEAMAFPRGKPGGSRLAVVFGTDQGMVGQFNDHLAAFVAGRLERGKGELQVLAVGDRIRSRLEDAGLAPRSTFRVPASVTSITGLVGDLIAEIEVQESRGYAGEVRIFHNRQETGARYEPTERLLLPMAEDGLDRTWPTRMRPQLVTGPALDETGLLRAFIREYLFVSLFGACAESLAAENSSRLAAMQGAERNISDLLDELGKSFNQLRQSSITEELFDVVSGSEALADEARQERPGRP